MRIILFASVSLFLLGCSNQWKGVRTHENTYWPNHGKATGQNWVYKNTTCSVTPGEKSRVPQSGTGLKALTFKLGTDTFNYKYSFDCGVEYNVFGRYAVAKDGVAKMWNRGSTGADELKSKCGVIADIENEVGKSYDVELKITDGQLEVQYGPSKDSGLCPAGELETDHFGI